MQTQNRPVDQVWGAGEEAVRGANGGRTMECIYGRGPWSVFTAVRKTDNQGKFAVRLKEL